MAATQEQAAQRLAGAVRLRIRVPGSGLTIQTGDVQLGLNRLPVKEWSLGDNVTNVSDPASFTVPNIHGENTNVFGLGQRVEIEEADDTVANGQWCRQFTGRITGIRRQSSLGGGSVVLVSCMDLGWHLTACHGTPLKNIRRCTIGTLVALLIDPSWGFAATQFSNTQNLKLKLGRAVINQGFQKGNLKAVFPYIQVEPGQAPFDLLKTYAERAGFLINVGVDGGLIIFQPSYSKVAQFSVEYHDLTDPRANRNNVIGQPTIGEDIGELAGEYQCWSTRLYTPNNADTTNPNQQYTRTKYKPAQNPLPFNRLFVFSDGEAITPDLRMNRAIWKSQMALSNAWTYEVEVPGHSQNGVFFVTDTMCSVVDSFHGVNEMLYVTNVQRSLTDQGGARTKLTLRRPVLNPSLLTLVYNSATKKSSTTKKPKS